MKKALSIKRLGKSFSYAIRGFFTTFKEEPNMQIHVMMALLVLICGFIFKVSKLEWVFLIFAIGMVIAAEIINTSIENLVDLAVQKYDKQAEIAKDTAAAYVLILSITAAVIGLIIFVPKLIMLF